MIGKALRILHDEKGNVAVERAGANGPYTCQFVYHPDLPEGDYFGSCLQCWAEDGVLRNDGYMNANGCDHWFICRKHRLKWSVGSNLFSAWRHMPEEMLLKQHYQLMDFRAVEPVNDCRSTAEYVDNMKFGRDPFAIPPEEEYLFGAVAMSESSKSLTS